MFAMFAFHTWSFPAHPRNSRDFLPILASIIKLYTYTHAQQLTPYMNS